MKKKVLIVDDEENFAHIVKMNLEADGAYDVRVETRSVRAPETARSFKPDVILLDIAMPEKDGYQVLEALKKNDRSMSIPVIMLTAMTDDASKIKASESYSEGYLVKPIDSKILREKIEEVLKRRFG